MQKQSFNKNWVYGEKAAVTDLTGVKGELKEVTLPYDAAFDQERDPDMENGYQKAYFPDKAYQYEKCWDVPADWKDKSVYLEFEGVFRDAEVLQNKNAVTTLKGNSETTCRQRIALQQIRCWSLEAPELYTCSCSIKTEDEIVDSETASFGIRRISVDAKHGFRLNGKEIKLRGACIHHDAGIIGGIANKSVEKRRIRKLKEAGFNAVRMAHNPSSTAVLEACDEEGMLVMEESFNVWNVMRFVDDYSSFFDDRIHPEDSLTLKSSRWIPQKDTVAALKRFVASEPVEEDQMFYMWGHGYEFDFCTPRNNWDNLKRLCEITANGKNIICCQNREIFLRSSAAEPHK